MVNQELNQSKYVTLVSSDGFEFVVLRKAAMISPAIRGMLDPKSKGFTRVVWASRCQSRTDLS